MAELATIARPYAEALFEAVGQSPDLAGIASQVNAIAAVAADGQVQRYADNPNVGPDDVQALITSVVGLPLSPPTANFLRALIDNHRLAVLPAAVAQFKALVNARSGVSDAVVYSAFPIDEAQLADLVATLEQRFGRKLSATVAIEPELIGGVRVVVGDEVLDTSVRARLEHMKAALTA